jgi:hypothetical protein
MRKPLLLTLLVATTALGANLSKDEVEARPLKGARKVFVMVEEISPLLSDAGIDAQGLTTTIELRLRRMGLEVIPVKPGHPTYLHLAISTLPAEKNVTVAYNMALSLADDVTLGRNKMLLPGTFTWQHSTLGVAGTYKIRESVEHSLDDLLNEFENAWRSVNPTPR